MSEYRVYSVDLTCSPAGTQVVRLYNWHDPRHHHRFITRHLTGRKEEGCINNLVFRDPTYTYVCSICVHQPKPAGLPE